MLAKLVCESIGMEKFQYQNSGAEANEAMIKLSRKYGIDKYKELVTRFNLDLLTKLKNNEILTPEEMANKMKKHYDYNDEYSR